MFGLADCNNFYASCERVFNPALNGKPVVVLSNNDGCVIARSNEAKELGIAMGVPAFQLKEFIRKNQVCVFSSNYTLYGDMSNRVMNTLSGFVSDIEIYSIDEAFLSFQGFDLMNLEYHAQKIVKTTTRNTGIPISLGIAPTKALAKIANKLAKKQSDKRGYYILRDDEEIHKVLKKYPIEDVWGIGGQYAKFLKSCNVLTAFDLTSKPKEWVQKHLTVVGVKIWLELKGFPSIELDTIPQPKKNICTARSFGNMLTELKDIEEALSNYTARCAEKLRKQGSCAGSMMVFIHTNQHRQDLAQYAKNIVIQLPEATNSSPELISFALKGLRAIYKKGYHYKKVGIIVMDFVPENTIQTNLFYTENKDRSGTLMKALDNLNSKYGKDSVRIASQGFNKHWKLRQEKLSPCYTTRWNDLLNVY